jgi:hypothetical protein
VHHGRGPQAASSSSSARTTPTERAGDKGGGGREGGRAERWAWSVSGGGPGPEVATGGRSKADAHCGVVGPAAPGPIQRAAQGGVVGGDTLELVPQREGGDALRNTLQ